MSGLSSPEGNMTEIRDLRALLVEPSTMQARKIAAELAAIGVTQLRFARAGAPALAAMREELPDFVVSSFHLPDFPASELISAMRAETLTERVPFILVSSETQPQRIDPVRQSGACAILPKPFTSAQLSAAVETAARFLASGDTLALGNVDLESLRVLIVDDSANSRKFMRNLLENFGIDHFFQAANGRMASELIDKTLVDLVITDYNMPEMDGRELIEHVRTKSWQSDVPIILVTSETNADRLAAVEKAGVSGICGKPFSPLALKTVIEEALRG
jgi:two-component system chemotaxis response regulator CheY